MEYMFFVVAVDKMLCKLKNGKIFFNPYMYSTCYQKFILKTVSKLQEKCSPRTLFL